MGANLFTTPLFLLLLLGLTSSQSITLIPTTPEVLNTLFTFLQCQLEPFDAMVEHGWRLPSGEFLTPDNDTDQIQVSKIGTSQLSGHMNVSVLVIIINQLSYQRAGVYSCEVQNTTTPGAEWVTAQVELQLRVDLEANSSTTVSVNDTDSEVQLSCEMSYFIREDEDLQWLKEGQMISSGMDRHNVTYTDGKPGVAIKGETNFIPGRVAVLTISNPEIEDSGTYTCAITGTDESIDFQLSVVPPVATPAGDGGEGGTSNNVGAIIGGVVGALFFCALVIAAVIVTIWCFARWQTREDAYDYVGPPQLPLGNGSVPMKENAAYNITTHCGPNFVSADYSTIDGCGHSLPANPVISDNPNPHNSTDIEDGSTPDPSYINTPSRADLENDGYSDPRYYGEEGQKPEATPGAITEEAEGGYPIQHVNATHQTQNTPDPSYINTPSRTDLENDGYSDPRYYGEEGRKPGVTRGAITGEEGTGYRNQPDTGVDFATHQTQNTPVPSYFNRTPLTQTDLDNDGYSDPRYYGEEDRKPEATRIDLENDSYSDPRYYGEEGRRPEATRGAITGEETKNNITTPDVGRTLSPAKR